MVEGREPAQEEVEAFVLAAHGDLDTVKRLHAREPALRDARWRTFDETALEAASHMGRREIAEYLLAAGAAPTICAAAMLGQTTRVAAFLDEDPALARAMGAHRIPVLFHAALGGRTEIADLLVAHGGGEGAGAALHGAVRPGHAAMVAWLLARGAGVDTPDFEGKTPLRVALDNGHAEIADLLRRHGARA
jgi:ankyrin repeat protein